MVDLALDAVGPAEQGCGQAHLAGGNDAADARGGDWLAGDRGLGRRGKMKPNCPPSGGHLRVAAAVASERKLSPARTIPARCSPEEIAGELHGREAGDWGVNSR